MSARRPLPKAQPRTGAAWLAAALGLLLWAPSVYAAGPAADPCPPAAQVGELGTVIGSGAIHAGELSRPARRGGGVCVGERIETGPGGHVHVRFVDGALLSVRPSSRLVIEAYPTRAPAPAPGATPGATPAPGPMRLRLEEGVVRSVSGEFARTQREQFRLKTPLAAIGIRGTDFIVQTSASSTRAAVLAGAIVVAPLAACPGVNGLCPAHALTLSADMSHLMIELSREHPLPRLLPNADLLGSRTLAPAASASPASAAGAKAASPAASSPAAPDGTSTASASSPGPASSAPGASPGHPPAASAASGSPAATQATLEAQAQQTLGQPVPQPLTLPPVEPPITQQPPPTPHKPLLWAHLPGLGAAMPQTISQRFDAALIDGRSPTVGNFFYTLYRDETVLAHFTPPSASASFALRSASAQFLPLHPWARASEVVQVGGASLQVDFANASFQTRLDLRSPSVHSTFAAQGQIDANGMMRASGPGQHLAGALATDGQQAGYLFQQALPDGSVQGLTLWGR